MLELKAYAKINLTLDILRKVDSGYHEINSVMQQIKLHDDVFLKKINGDEIKVRCNKEIKGNLAHKAALLLKNKFDVKEGVEIKIEKNIPIAAGLSGGSTDAAATLTGLNSLWNLELTKDELMGLASDIGKDVPFHIIGGACRVSGMGEEVKKINSLKMDMVIINPGFRISTKEAYNNLDLNETGKKLKTDDMIKAINNRNINEAAADLHNDFELSIMKKHPVIKKIKEDLIKNNSLNALMTGSGPTVFGIFENEDKARNAYDNLKDKFNFVCMTKTI